MNPADQHSTHLDRITHAEHLAHHPTNHTGYWSPPRTLRLLAGMRQRAQRHPPCTGCPLATTHTPMCHRCVQEWPCQELRADIRALDQPPAPGFNTNDAQW